VGKNINFSPRSGESLNHGRSRLQIRALVVVCKVSHFYQAVV